MSSQKKQVNMRQEFFLPQRRHNNGLLSKLKRQILSETTNNQIFSKLLSKKYLKIRKDCTESTESTESTKKKCITEKQKDAFLYFLGAFPEYMSDTIFDNAEKKLATDYYQAAILKKSYNNNINVGGSKKRKQVNKKKSKKSKKTKNH